MPSERLQVILELVTGQYKAEAKQAAAATDRIGGSAGGVTSKLGAMIGPAAIGGAVIGLANMALKAGENADRLFDLAAQTGLSTDALQEWEFVAKTAGASTEVFSDAVKAVIRNLNETEGATGAAAKAYDALGISVLDAGGNLRDAGSITDEVFEKLSGMTNITQRNALAQDIFGKKWEETISVLDLGADAIGAARREAHDLGVVITGDSLKGADEFRETWERVKATLQGRLMQILGDLGPVLTDVADSVGDIVTELEPLLEGLGWLVDRYSDLKGGLDNLEESDNAFLEFLGKAGGAIVGFGGGLGAVLRAVDDLTPAAKAAAEKTGDLGDAATYMADAAKDDAVPALDRLADAQRTAEDAAKAHRDALIQLTNRMLAQLNPALGAYQALQDLKDAQLAAADAAKEHGEDSEEAAATQLELAVATATAQAALNNFGDTEGAVDALAEALDISKVAAADLLVQLGLISGKDWETTVLLHVRTDSELAALQGGVIPEGMGLKSGTTTTRAGGTGRAFGGPVRAGEMYMVGERGPEMFVSGQSGSIIPNGALSRTTTINVNSPSNNLAQDLQYAALLASVQAMVE